MTSPSDMTPEQRDAWDEREEMLTHRIIPHFGSLPDSLEVN